MSDRYIIRTTGQTGPGIAAHLADTTDAHDASAISFSATGNLASTDVQAALTELDTEKAAVAEPIAAAHIADGTAAHAASAVSFTPAGSIAATDVQAALVEVDGDVTAHISDTSDAHDASAISVLDTAGNFTGTDVEAVLAELPGRYGSPTVALQQVPIASNSRWSQQGFSSAGIASANYRWRRTILARAHSIRLVYVNSAINELTTPPATITVTAAFETADGTRWPVFFNGRREVAIEPYGTVESDPLPIEVQQGDQCFTRTFVTGPQWPTGPAVKYTGEGGDNATNGTDQTVVGTIATNSVYLYGPLQVLGTPYAPLLPSVVGVGDSIMFGQGDTPATGAVAAGAGFFDRAMNNAVLFTNLGSSGDTIGNIVTNAGHRVRYRVIGGHKHAVVQAGINDLHGGGSLATIQAALILAWQQMRARGCIVTQLTYTPRPSASTDGYLTEASQTPPAYESIRSAINAWLRAGAPVNSTTFAASTVGAAGAIVAGNAGHPLFRVVDTAAAVEGAVAGTWRQDPARRNITVSSSGGTQVTSTDANFTAEDLWRTIQIPGAGAAGATIWPTIYQVESATSVRVSGPAVTTAVSGVSAVIGTSLTGDGTHPSVAGHIALAAALPATTLFT